MEFSTSNHWEGGGAVFAARAGLSVCASRRAGGVLTDAALWQAPHAESTEDGGRVNGVHTRLALLSQLLFARFLFSFFSVTCRSFSQQAVVLSAPLAAAKTCERWKGSAQRGAWGRVLRLVMKGRGFGSGGCWVRWTQTT